MAGADWVGLTIFVWWFSYLHSLVLQDLTQLKENVRVLRLKNRLLQKEKIELQESCEEVKRLIKEVIEKICGHQVGRGSGGLLTCPPINIETPTYPSTQPSRL